MTRFPFSLDSGLEHWLRRRRRRSGPITAGVLAVGLLLWSCGSEEVRPEPQAEFVPGTLTFPTIALGDTARASVTLVSRTYKFLTVTLRPSSDDLSVLRRDSTLTFELDAWEEVPLEVVFHPTTEDLSPLRVEIEGIRCAPLAVAGSGKEDPCRSTPERVEFGWVRLGEERTLGFTVHCDGPDSVAGDLQGGGSGFAVVPQGPFSLAPGESLQVSATYHPQERGEHTGTVTLGSEWCENVVLAGSSGREWRVRQDGTGDAVTVQAGIDGASDGDVVIVEPGRYYETINLRGKGIHLKSEQGPEVTILDGSRGDDSVVACDSGETNDTIIEGFTITGGKGRVRGINGRMGAGVLCLDATPVIQGNVITGNAAITPPGGNQSQGGGMLYGRREGSPSLVQPLVLRCNIVRENFASNHGGGVYLGEPCIVEGNGIVRNRSGTDGGGVYLARTKTRFSQNLIAENVAGDHGGGLYIVNSGLWRVSNLDVEIFENLIVRNSALGLDGASDCSGGGVWVSGGAWIHRNTIAFNHAESVEFPAGGGICLFATSAETIVEYNVISRSDEGGVVAFWWASGNSYAASVRRNNIYGNGLKETYNNNPDGFDLQLKENIFEDPQFCVDDESTDGLLAENSPAFSQPWGVIGAVAQPGCGPRAARLKKLDIWGPIMARHGP